jgi:uncharacterized protein YndB with AHSA1/START domain
MADDKTISHSVVIDATPEALYDMLADVTRMGEWSDACTGATWDEGAGPTAVDGVWFTGHNKAGEHSYDTHCQITAAERPTAVAWMQRGKDEGFTEWRYEFEPAEGGTKVTESWIVVRDFPSEAGIDEERSKMMREAFTKMIEDTLSKLKVTVES